MGWLKKNFGKGIWIGRWLKEGRVAEEGGTQSVAAHQSFSPAMCLSSERDIQLITVALTEKIPYFKGGWINIDWFFISEKFTESVRNLYIGHSFFFSKKSSWGFVGLLIGNMAVKGTKLMTN